MEYVIPHRVSSKFNNLTISASGNCQNLENGGLWHIEMIDTLISLLKDLNEVSTKKL